MVTYVTRRLLQGILVLFGWALIGHGRCSTWIS
jgi:hypothetical protein